MFRNNLIVAWRSLLRNSLHTSINIFGLMVGITACFAIFTIVRFEHSFNRNHPDADRIYRIYSEYSGTISGTNRGVTAALSAFIKDNFTGLELVANFHTLSTKVEIPLNDGSLKDMESQSNLILAVPDYIDLVGQYQWLSGSKKALEQPNKVVLTESQAIKYFGKLPFDEMLGREIIYKDSLYMQVGGVVSDIKENSDFAFTDILSFATIKATWLKDNYPFEEWGSTNSSSQLFVKLTEETPVENLEDQLLVAIERDKEESNFDGWSKTFLLQPLSELHYNTKLGVFDNTSHVADLGMLQILSWVALAILIIAAINFINLETALATRRSREVGIRKVLGSSRSRLILYFLNQSFIVTAGALILSIPLIQVSLILFKEYIPEGISFELGDSLTLMYLGMTIIIVGLLAGLYPAFVMSSFSPVQSLKSQGTGKRKSLSANLRKGLTIFQFWFSQVLIIGTVIVGMQIHYMTTKDLGFESKSIVYFYVPYYEEISKRDVLRNELERIPEITSLCNFSQPPAQTGYTKNVTTLIKDSGEEVKSSVHQKNGDTTYVSFFGLEFVAGRNFRDNAVEKEAIVNEAFMKEFGFEDPFDLIDHEFKRGKDTVRVVGVLKDFYFRSLHNSIEPLMIFLSKDSRSFGIKLAQNANAEKVIEKIKDEFVSVYPERTFTHYFFDETIEKFYNSEKRASKLAMTATIIAIIISCLGLFGLASFTTVQRTKEIGIRKVLGATANMIVTLLSKDFLKLVLIAIIIAIPFGYWVSTMWLEDFAYKVNISPWIFILCGLSSVLIAFLTVGYQSVKASLADPAESLRYE